MDHPNERSLHASAVPRAGGVGVLAGIAIATVGLWLAGLATGPGLQPDELRRLLAAVVLLAGVSLMDDLWSLSPILRIAVQVVAATMVATMDGMAITTLALPGLAAWDLGSAAPVLTALLIVWMTNLYNFMDGMDGLAGTMTVVGCLFLALLGWPSAPQVVVIACVVGGASAGFLLLNLPPARLFLGDVGAVPLGFIAVTLILLLRRAGTVDLLPALLIFAPFVLDATGTLARRIVRGAPVWRPHREHSYQRLVLSGRSHGQVLRGEALLMLLSGALAYQYVHGSDLIRALVIATTGVLWVSIAWWAGRVPPRPPAGIVTGGIESDGIGSGRHHI